MLAASVTTTANVEIKHIRPLLLRGRRHEKTEENLPKESLPQAVVPHEGDVKKRDDITLKETLRIRRVIIGILPHVNITKQNRDANSAKCAYSGTLRLTVSPGKSRRKVLVKGFVAFLKNSKQLGCVFQDVAPPKPFRFYARAQHFWDQSAACTSQKVHYAT